MLHVQNFFLNCHGFSMKSLIVFMVLLLMSLELQSTIRQILPENANSPFVQIGGNIVCGVTLLSSNIAISAKHCFFDEEGNQMSETPKISVHGLEYTIEELVKFEDGYKKFLHHDLIILKLSEHVRNQIIFARIPDITLEEQFINTQSNHHDGTGIKIHGRHTYMKGYDVDSGNELLLNNPETNFQFYESDYCQKMGSKINLLFPTDDNTICIRTYITINVTIDKQTFTQELNTPIRGGDSGSALTYTDQNGIDYILAVVSTPNLFPRIVSNSARAWIVQTAKYLHEKYNSDSSVNNFFNSLPNKNISETIKMNGSMDGETIKSYLQQLKVLIIKSINGNWGQSIELPREGVEEGKMVKFIRNAQWETEINYKQNFTITPEIGNVVTFTYKNNQWRVRGFNGPPITIYMNGNVNASICDAYLQITDELIIISKDGAWGRYIDLPDGINSQFYLRQKRVKFIRKAGYFTEVRFNKRYYRNFKLYDGNFQVSYQSIIIGVPKKQSLTIIIDRYGWLLEKTQTRSISLSGNSIYQPLDSTKNLTIISKNGEWVKILDLPYHYTKSKTIKFIRKAQLPTKIFFHGQHNERQAYVIPHKDQSVLFTPSEQSYYWDIAQSGQSNQLKVQMDGKMSPDTIMLYLRRFAEVIIRSSDGWWGRYIDLPIDGVIEDGKIVKFLRTATYSTTIRFAESQYTPAKGQTMEFVYESGTWKI